MAEIEMLWVIFLFLFFVCRCCWQKKQQKKTRTTQNFKGEKKRTNIVPTNVQIKLITKIQTKLQIMCKKLHKQMYTQGLKCSPCIMEFVSNLHTSNKRAKTCAIKYKNKVPTKGQTNNKE